jgi:hypothetical protein
MLAIARLRLHEPAAVGVRRREAQREAPCANSGALCADCPIADPRR